MSEGKIQFGITQVQGLQLQQKQIVTQTQLITARLFEVPSFMIGEFIEQEAGESVLVNEDLTSSYGIDGDHVRRLFKKIVKVRRDGGVISSDDDTKMAFLSNLAEEENFIDSVIRDFRASTNDPRKEKIGMIIFQFIDKDGMLRGESGYAWEELVSYIKENAHDLGLDPVPDEEEIEEVLKFIQSLDPPGVGSRNLWEFLIALLEYGDRKGEDIELAKKMLYAFKDDVDSLTDYLERKDYGSIAGRAGMTVDEVKRALDAIVAYNAKIPASLFRPNRVKNTVSLDELNKKYPVAVVNVVERKKRDAYGNEWIEKELEVDVKWQYSSQLHVDEEAYKQLVNILEAHPELLKELETEIEKFKTIKKVLMFADNVIEAISKLVVEKQKDYFLTGDESKLKPLTMKEIADEIGRDPSTVSRALQGKYLETPWGEVIEFSRLFPRTDNKVKQLIKELIESEPPNKPYSDSQIEKILNMKGYRIARRTVQKYRDLLGIPRASERKKMRKKG